MLKDWFVFLLQRAPIIASSENMHESQCSAQKKGEHFFIIFSSKTF